MREKEQPHKLSRPNRELTATTLSKKNNQLQQKTKNDEIFDARGGTK